EILFQDAMTRGELGDRAAAIAGLERVLNHRGGQHFSSVDTGLTGYIARHNLAVFLHQEGRVDDAEKQWEMAIAEQPRFASAIAHLADIPLARRDWPALNAKIEQLKALGCVLETQVLTARKHFAEKNYTLARLTI